MNFLRPDYTDTEMISAIRSKCSDVKKQVALNQKKRSLTLANFAAPTTSFGAKRRSTLNGHASLMNYSSNEGPYINGISVKNETTASNLYRNNSAFLDESSSEYFQDME